MNLSLISTEISVAFLGVLVLLADLWTPKERKPQLGWVVLIGLMVAFALVLKKMGSITPVTLQGYSHDKLTAFFHIFFLLAGILVTLLTLSYAPRIRTGIKKVEAAAVAGDAGAAKEALKAVQPVLMAGVGKGVVVKNTASRKLSRLSAQIKALS